MKASPKQPNYPIFSERLLSACERNPNIPAKNFGQLGWISKNIQEKSGKGVTEETVRKWLAGMAFPRQSTLLCLAEVVDSNPAWLSGLPDHAPMSAKVDALHPPSRTPSEPAKVPKNDHFAQSFPEISNFSADEVSINVKKKDFERLTAYASLFTISEVVTKLLDQSEGRKN